MGAARGAGLPIPSLATLLGSAIDTLERQTAFLRELSAGIAEQLDGAGLSFVNTWVSEKLEGLKEEYTDVTVAATVANVPQRLKEVVQRSYGEVRALLDALDPKGPWEAKVRDPERCGLVKAVCTADGSFEWVEPHWEDPYKRRGRALLGLGKSELGCIAPKQRVSSDVHSQ